MKYSIWMLSSGLLLTAACTASADEPAPKPAPAPVIVNGYGCPKSCCGDRVLFQFKSLRRHSCGTLCCNPCPTPCPAKCPTVCPQDCGPRCKLSLFSDRPRCQTHPPCCEPCPKPCEPTCGPTCRSKFSLRSLFHRKDCCNPCGTVIYTKPAEPIQKMPEPKPGGNGSETLLPAK